MTIILMTAAGTLSACWSDKAGCDLWAHKLQIGEDPATAVRQLAESKCVGQRKLLLDHLDDAGLRADALAALIALERSPEAEQAVVASIAHPETVAAAAKQAGEWQLAAAEPAIRAALDDAALATHREELLQAGLAVAPAQTWVATAVATLGDEHAPAATLDGAFTLLAAVDWSGVPPDARAAVVSALAALLSRPAGAVTPERRAAALKELARV
ncbi:MAG: hypothetical protein KC635_15285, partial [Myxococcales bacterium]|nr:hypothetical protein [Myxococcales bacterium]